MMFLRRSCKHRKDELICRQVQGDERKNTMKFVEHQLPRAYHLKCFSNISKEEIESGCRDSAPSKTVLKQIRYEARKVLTPFEANRKVYQKSIRNSSNIAQA